MARTTLTNGFVTLGSLVSSYTAGVADVVPAAGDVSNGNEAGFTGEELVLAHNGGASPYTVTIGSQPCPHGRTGDIVYSLAAGDYAVLGPFRREGWNNGGMLDIDVENIAVEVVVIRIPKEQLK